MMLGKSFNLEINDEMIVPLPIQTTIEALNWNQFCDARSLPEEELGREFYTNLIVPDASEVLVCMKKVPFASKSINDLFNMPDVEEDEYSTMMTNIKWDFLQEVFNVVAKSRSQWIIRKYDSHYCRREYLKPVAKIVPNKPEYDESSSKSEPKANSVNETKEAESEGEPNSPKPRVEENTTKLVEPTVNLELTIPITASSNTMNKSKFSTMMDMWKFMQNQQQAYWKYAKIRYDSIRTTFKNISNSFIPEFPDHIFESWQEEDMNISENDKAKKQDRGDDSKQ
ncbi:hypothetical protein PVK06_008629 [Gossypium arboreum]|uniref:Uncharacterized protein n=1 Tax=Gossypium arboreum TaxID=29729 RepID=A0ABR0QKD7_GOSAR|nr:hypothetical protein PVK06_008629 [Gossypium arboreum]